MKTYNIYKNSSGQVEAVKQGWSWPGFFFTWLWCFVKGLPGLGAGLFIAFLFVRIMSMQSEAMNALAFLAGLGVSIWIGTSGNEMRGNRLQEKGYEFVSTMDADSPEWAVTEFVKKKAEVKPTESVEKFTATLPVKTSTFVENKSEIATMPVSNEERLILAAKEGDIQTVKALLNAGIDVNATVEGYAGMTPLMHASRSNNIDCVKVLISAGANVSMKNELGRTALKIAEGNGNREIVKLLEEAGAREERT